MLQSAMPCTLVHAEQTPCYVCSEAAKHAVHFPLTPVKAVPAMNHANGSRYQGLMLIRYKLADTDASVTATALQALAMFSWNTYRRRNPV